MVLKNSIYKTIKKGIEDEIYKRVRLVRVNEEGENEPITTYSSYLKGGKENCIKQLDFIRFQLENKLPNGTYIIQANTAPIRNGVDDDFKVVKNITIAIKSHDTPIEDHTQHQEEDMAGIDIDDYKKVLEELSEMKSICQAQRFKIEMLEKELAAKKDLADDVSRAPKGFWDHLGSAVVENKESIFGTLDSFLKLGKDKMKLENRKLDLAERGIPINGNHKPKKIKRVMPKNEDIDYDKVVDEMEKLMEQNEEEFNKAMDELEKVNPDIYDYVCEELDLFEDDGEVEEEIGEEEEDVN